MTLRDKTICLQRSIYAQQLSTGLWILVHGPYGSESLAEADIAYWRSMGVKDPMKVAP